MEEIRKVAAACVGRAVMFGTLAIACVMVGFSFAPVSAFRSGALLSLLMSLILLWKAMSAPRTPHRRTEVWLYLDERSRPVDSQAQLIVGSVMRDIYARYAQISLAVAVGFFALSLILQLFGLQAYQVPYRL